MASLCSCALDDFVTQMYIYSIGGRHTQNDDIEFDVDARGGNEAQMVCEVKFDVT